MVLTCSRAVLPRVKYLETGVSFAYSHLSIVVSGESSLYLCLVSVLLALLPKFFGHWP